MNASDERDGTEPSTGFDWGCADMQNEVTQAAKAASDAMYADAPDASTADVVEAEEVAQFRVDADSASGVASVVVAEYGETRTWKDGTSYFYLPPPICRVTMNCKRSWEQTLSDANRICRLLNDYGL